ncbi:hypothetical protein DL770_000636 [Monosporascus sp. CRB-9-2]|nr:hypothetical protein DL770_000636 [Monosporascus sp. CRB-9-2]
MAEINTRSSEPERGAKYANTWMYRSVPIMDEVEDLEDYQPGGLAPLDLGDNLANRFQIIYKLGFGGMATVWLCWEIDTEQWRAIKVNAASQSSEDCSDLLAIRHMKEQGVTPEQLETNHVVMPLETFWMESPNGRHLCLVLPLLGPNLIDWRSDKLGVDMDRVDKLCYQTAKGLSFLHSKGLCHGDFRPQNILMKLKPGCIDHLSRDDVWDVCGFPSTAEVRTATGERSKHAPNEVVGAAPWTLFQDHVIDEVAIVDFGQAYKAHEPRKELGIPAAYASPEVLFDKGQFGVGSDIWSLATTLLEVKIDRRARDSADESIRYMERFIGPVPPYYRQEAKRILEEHGWDDMEQGPQDFDSTSRTGGAYKAGSTGKLLPLTGPVDIPVSDDEERDARCKDFAHPLEMRLGIEQRAWGLGPDHTDPTGENQTWVRLKYYLPRNEVLGFADLLKRMYKYKPEERLSASQVLSHRWFEKQRPKQAPALFPRIPRTFWVAAAAVLFASLIWPRRRCVQRFIFGNLLRNWEYVRWAERCKRVVLYVCE